MTLSPSRFSLVERLTPSISHCMRFMNGKLSFTRRMITMTRTIRAMAVTAVHSKAPAFILLSAQTAMMGALTLICNPLAVNSCMWYTSLVDLVMRLAAENELMSCFEKDCTLSNSSFLRFLLRLAAVLALIAPAHNDAARLRRE